MLYCRKVRSGLFFCFVVLNTQSTEFIWAFFFVLKFPILSSQIRGFVSNVQVDTSSAYNTGAIAVLGGGGVIPDLIGN